MYGVIYAVQCVCAVSECSLFQLNKRREKREKAQDELKTAEEGGNVEDIEKFQKRIVRVSKQQNEDCKELLRLMGVPVVEVTLDKCG